MKGDLTDRVADLETQLAAVSVAGRQRLARPVGPFAPQQVKLAVTYTDPTYLTYPSFGANTFPIKFVDATFTQASGVNPVTNTARSAAARTYAHTLAGSAFVPANTLVVVARICGRWWILSTLPSGRFGRVTAQLAGSGGALGTVELYDSEFNDLGKSLSVAALTTYPIGAGTYVSIDYDPVLDQFYTPDRQSVQLGIVSGTSINAGSTGSIVIKDDQGNTLYTQTGVRALTLLVRSQQVAVVFDYTKAEFFAWPLDIPLLVQTAAAIAYHASGTVNVLDSGKGNAGGALTQVTAYSAIRDLQNGEFCLMHFDFYQTRAWLVPIEVGIAGEIDFHMTGTLAHGDANTGGHHTIDSYRGTLPTGTITIANPLHFSLPNGGHGWATLSSYNFATGDATYRIRSVDMTDWSGYSPTDVQFLGHDNSGNTAWYTTAVQTVVTDSQDDTTAHELQKKTRDLRIVPDAAESGWVTQTGGTQEPDDD